MRSAPVSWPISSLERGRLGSGQVQTALLKRRYPETAWAAHGNYGIEYDLTLPLLNDTSAPVRLQLALDSPSRGMPRSAACASTSARHGRSPSGA